MLILCGALLYIISSVLVTDGQSSFLTTSIKDGIAQVYF